MNRYLYSIHEDNLPNISQTEQEELLQALESGKIVYLPICSFAPRAQEKTLLNAAILHPKSKNISYDYHKARISGLHANQTETLTPVVQSLMHRYALFSKQLIDTMFPRYQHHIQMGRTSFRPAEILGRKTSKRKDDTRLHVDSFAATPVNGLRILRVFCNINPEGNPRIWHVGEPFSQVLTQFAKQLPSYRVSKAKLLNWVKATKSLRTPYDHYMLHLHDQMKRDDIYQHSVPKQQIAFPAQSAWIVFTDQVSHAALSGQFLLEQTFYLPVQAMQDPHFSPLKQWEQEKQAALI